MAISIRRGVPGDEGMLSLLGSATFLETYAGYVAGEDILRAARNWHSAAFYEAWLAHPDVTVQLAEVDAGRAAIRLRRLGAQ